MKTIRIGNGQGFWGDNVDAPVELLRGGPIDYIGMDYLAEVTLSIMMRQKLKDPTKGYATDFVALVRRVLPELKQRGVRSMGLVSDMPNPQLEPARPQPVPPIPDKEVTVIRGTEKTRVIVPN